MPRDFCGTAIPAALDGLNGMMGDGARSAIWRVPALANHAHDEPVNRRPLVEEPLAGEHVPVGALSMYSYAWSSEISKRRGWAAICSAAASSGSGWLMMVREFEHGIGHAIQPPPEFAGVRMAPRILPAIDLALITGPGKTTRP